MDWKATILKYAITLILTMLTPEMIKKFADHVLDFVENTVTASATTVDDSLLPICQIIRLAFGIEDNDEVIAPKMSVARRKK